MHDTTEEVIQMVEGRSRKFRAGGFNEEFSLTLAGSLVWANVWSNIAAALRAGYLSVAHIDALTLSPTPEQVIRDLNTFGDVFGLSTTPEYL